MEATRLGDDMFTIGEFSRATGLSVKALRLYHEKGVLVPAAVDEDTGYRYYDPRCIEKARTVALLREMDFALSDIKAILDGCDDDADVLDYLRRHRAGIEQRIRHHTRVTASLDRIITREEEAKKAMAQSEFRVQEKTLEPMWIAGVRMKGKYSDCGQGFARIGRSLGRHICGKPFCLYYDGEYRENDADLEACMPVRDRVEAEGVSVRELPGGHCVSLMHQGPYETLGRSYEKILAYAHEKGYRVALPTREVYVKGPGMIFRGNPVKYLTEIQIPVET